MSKNLSKTLYLKLRLKKMRSFTCKKFFIRMPKNRERKKELLKKREEKCGMNSLV